MNHRVNQHTAAWEHAFRNGPGQTGLRFWIGLVVNLGALSLLPPIQSASNLIVSTPARVSSTAAGGSFAPVLGMDGNRVLFLSRAPNLVTNEDLGPHLNLFARDIFSPGTTTLLSVSTNGHSGANASITRYALGSIGVWLVFETAASNLTRNDTNGVSDIFLRGFDSMTRLISVNAAGTGPGNGRSYNPLVSRYGERVVFVSEASDLVPNDTNGVADVFVRDMQAGQTRLVSINAAGTGSGNASSDSPYLPEYGSHVAFVSRATDLVAGVTNTLGEVYVYDFASRTTRWANAGLTTNSSPCLRSPCTGLPADGYVPSEPVTFDGGRFVVFKVGTHAVVRWEFQPAPNTPNERVHRLDAGAGEFLAGPLMAGFDAGFVGYVAGRADASGQITNSWLRRISFGTPIEVVSPENGTTNLVYAAYNAVSGAPVDGRVFGPSMSMEGDRFVFASDATRLLSPPPPATQPPTTQIYLHTMGAPFSVLMSAKTNGAPGPDLNGVIPTVSRLLRTIAWESPDPSLVPDDGNRDYDVFLRDLNQGSTTLISARHSARPALTGIGPSRLGPGGLSGNGRVIAFSARDTTFVDNDTNRLEDAFAFNLVTGARHRLTVSATNAEPFPPALNLDGRYAVFEQVTFPFGGTTGVTNSYRADLLSNTVASVGRNQGQVAVPAGGPSMTPDGRFVAFHSAEFAPNLALFGPGDANPSADVFLRDFSPPLTNGPRIDTIVVSRSRFQTVTGNAESRAPVISRDGRWVAFHSLATDLTYDLVPASQRHQVFAYDRTRNSVKLLSYTPNPPGSNATALTIVATNPVFSADSRFAFFTGHSNINANSITQSAIFRHNLQNDPISVVTTNGTNFPFIFLRTNIYRLTNDFVCGSCANPSVSADGRLVAFEIAAGATTNIMVRDLQTGNAEVISLFGNTPGRAHRPLLSLDGRYVVYTTTAVGPSFDFNQAADVFVHDRRNRVTHVVSRAMRYSGPFLGPPPDTGNGPSFDPVMSLDGRTIAFHSFASNLAPGDYNDSRDVFVLSLGSDDIDRDGMADDWELTYFSSLSQPASGDADGDGMTNVDEFRAGTDPTNLASVFQVLLVTPAAGPMGVRATVIWSAAPGQTYRVQARMSLDAPWQDVPGDVIAWTASAAKTFDTMFPPRQGYFRAMLVP